MKTLKDIHGFLPYEQVVDEDQADKHKLREGAKEWIDYCFDEAKKHEPHSHGEQCSLAEAHILMQFFNLEGYR